MTISRSWIFNLVLILNAWAFEVQARSLDQCHLIVSEPAKHELKYDFDLFSLRLKPKIENLETQNLMALSEILDNRSFYLDFNNKNFNLYYNITAGEYRNIKTWIPLTKKYSLAEVKQLSCASLKNLILLSKQARKATQTAYKLLYQQSLKHDETLGESVITLEWFYARKKFIGYGSLTKLKEQYLKILTKIKSIQEIQRNDEQFFERWLEVINEIYGEYRENIDYCLNSTLLIDALKNRCTNCQGQTALFLSLFLDAKFKEPKGWGLSIQTFKDHIRPVLYNADQRKTFDLMYGKWGTEVGAISDWNSYFKHLLVGSQILIHPLEMNQVKDFETKYSYSEWFCGKFEDKGQYFGLQIMNFTGLKACSYFADPGQNQSSDPIDLSGRTSTKVENEVLGEGRSGEKINKENKSEGLVSDVINSLFGNKKSDLKSKGEDHGDGDASNTDQHSDLAAFNSGHSGGWDKDASGTIRTLRDLYPDSFVNNLNSEESTLLKKYFKDGSGQDFVLDRFRWSNYSKIIKAKDIKQGPLPVYIVELNENQNTNIKITTVKEKKDNSGVDYIYTNVIYLKDKAFYSEIISYDYIRRLIVLSRYVDDELFKIKEASEKISISNLKQSLKIIKIYKNFGDSLQNILYANQIFSALSSNDYQEITEGRNQLNEKYNSFLQDVFNHSELLFKSVMELHDEFGAEILDLNLDTNIKYALYYHVFINKEYFFTPPRADFEKEPLDLNSYFQNQVDKFPIVNLPKVNWGYSCPNAGIFNLGQSSVAIECHEKKDFEAKSFSENIFRNQPKISSNNNIKPGHFKDSRQPVIIPSRYWGTLLKNSFDEDIDYFSKVIIHYIQQDSILKAVTAVLGQENLSVPDYFIRPSLHYQIPYDDFYTENVSYELLGKSVIKAMDDLISDYPKFKSTILINKMLDQASGLKRYQVEGYGFVQVAFDEFNTNTKSGWSMTSWSDNSQDLQVIHKIHDTLFVNPEASEFEVRQEFINQIEKIKIEFNLN